MAEGQRLSLSAFVALLIHEKTQRRNRTKEKT
jgi:hypothetical protein